MINLTKATAAAKISLEKKQIFGEKAQVVMILDKSASMGGFYRRGVVQEIVTRLLGIGMNMDDNKSIEVFVFDNDAEEMHEANESNHAHYIQDMLTKTSLGGGTKYAKPMKMVLDKFVPRGETKKTGFFRRKVETTPAGIAELPTFVFFITDGDCFDPDESEKVIRDASNQAVFWQFVGIGSESFRFLKKMDDMPGRFLDNVDFFHVADPSEMSDSELYDKLLNEFPQWIKDARGKGILQ